MARKPKHEEHENHERWLVSYADFITLLFAFFTVLYATAQSDQKKLEAVVDSVNAAFEGGMPKAIMEVFSGASNSDIVPTHLNNDVTAVPVIDNIKQNLTGSLSDNVVQIGLVEQELVLVIPETLLFAAGSADLHPAAYGVLTEIVNAVANTPARIEVTGHADSAPVPPDSVFRDNWGLATARAVSTVRYLQRKGIAPERLTAMGAITTTLDPGARVVALRIRCDVPAAAADIAEQVDHFHEQTH
jgi:chemotaxis protein MotB